MRCISGLVCAVLLVGMIVTLGPTRCLAQTGAAPLQNDKPDAQAKSAGWVDDLTNVDFPKTKAAGKLHGKEFTMERAEVQGGVLTLRQGSAFFADLEWKIFLFAPDISRLEGHFLNIETEETEPVQNMPHVYYSWKENGKDLPKQRSMTGGYIIKLKFGKAANGKIPGQIYLCVPDFKRSYVAGTFEAVIK